MELVVMCSLYLGWALARRGRWSTLASLGGAVLTGVLLFLTKTRGALLTLCLVTVPAVCVFQQCFGSLRRRLAAASLCVFLAAPVATLVWYYLASPERRSPDTVYTRLAAYKRCVRIVANAPWSRTVIGHGPRPCVFPAVAEQYGTDSPTFLGEKLCHAHNDLLQVLLEAGLLGMALLGTIWAVAFWSAWSAWRRGAVPEAKLASVLLPGLITFIAVSQFDCTLFAPVGHLGWFVVGLAFASGTSGEEDRARGGGEAFIETETKKRGE
jgi:O-antigen ligase